MLTRTRHGKAIGKGSEPMDFGIIIAETWLKIIGLMIQFSLTAPKSIMVLRMISKYAYA
jgi:hypothetical protein